MSIMAGKHGSGRAGSVTGATSQELTSSDASMEQTEQTGRAQGFKPAKPAQ